MGDDAMGLLIFLGAIFFSFIGGVWFMDMQKHEKLNFKISKCIEIQTNHYGDLIGEDPDQSPQNIIRATGEAIKECLK